MQKVTILFFADSHLGFDHPVKPTANQKRRGFDFFRNYNSILETARKEKVDLVIHGGDLFDHSNVHPRIVNQAYDALFALADTNIPVVLVPGNHDRSTLPTSLFLQHPNIYIFFEPQMYTITLKDTPLYLCGFPFVRNIGLDINSLLEYFKTILPPDGRSILCMHQAVEGATVGVVNYTFRPGPQVIAMQQLAGPFELYLSGHIHRQQMLMTRNTTAQSEQVPFIYPGSIERTSFAERLEEKGYLMMEFTDNKLPSVRFEQLPSRPMHQLPIEVGDLSLSQLTELINAKIKNMEPTGILQIDSPSQGISKWLGFPHIKDLIPPSIYLEIRHRWINKKYSE